MRWVILGVAGCASGPSEAERQAAVQQSSSLEELMGYWLPRAASESEIAPADRAEAVDCVKKATVYNIPESDKQSLLVALKKGKGNMRVEEDVLVKHYLDLG